MNNIRDVLERGAGLASRDGGVGRRNGEQNEGTAFDFTQKERLAARVSAKCVQRERMEGEKRVHACVCVCVCVCECVCVCV